jgi:hypothetical protein
VDLQQERSVIESCLRFFAVHGFFESEPLNKADQSMLREKLFSLLSLMISDSSEVWASVAVMQIAKLEDEKLKKVVKLDSAIKKIRKTGLKSMKKLRAMVQTFFCIS